MKILTIDKDTYRKKTNLVMVGFVGCLAVLAILFGSILIALFGSEGITESGSTGNFHLNVLGVILAVIASSFIMNKVKSHPYFDEIMYVWKLKQVHNRIYRKLAKIKEKATRNDHDSLLILAFYYTTQQQVFTLDNNTLTITAVQKSLNEVYEQATEMNFTLDLDDFTVDLLNKYQ
ncbi:MULTISPECIES: DUF3087 domain-containing protein [Aliivibrio]|uniref:DUF3087 domain-containing protein n=1 Tax=Aliivibrio finisterrensis TaxID=511998 RepID=A0A4V1Z9A5_9GAMM|nr:MULTISPECIES: DUF3087 domain-containing protein [Aliivibrio]MDD9177343.1 DUF3087 domain-containing protein [Aliivibrio sp. A6]RYU54825.1 DUF3087 domain-containing protein [Aliivibrio finisterrensis]RYU56500.1 DUF3087 domain-containing protein [Aliivibrio finisterrensis]RYU61621.1 DUF3087 domain-containing protein [Aliivibrio finisterrensis]RYU66790.1 DUF3087 domain-containing protein [Aliivibrio finisterrensis]